MVAFAVIGSIVAALAIFYLGYKYGEYVFGEVKKDIEKL